VLKTCRVKNKIKFDDVINNRSSPKARSNNNEKEKDKIKSVKFVGDKSSFIKEKETPDNKIKERIQSFT